jgi:hypothetical protein
MYDVKIFSQNRKECATRERLVLISLTDAIGGPNVPFNMCCKKGSADKKAGRWLLMPRVESKACPQDPISKEVPGLLQAVNTYTTLPICRIYIPSR